MAAAKGDKRDSEDKLSAKFEEMLVIEADVKGIDDENSVTSEITFGQS